MALDHLFAALGALAHQRHAGHGVDGDGGGPGPHVAIVVLGIHRPAIIDGGLELQVPETVAAVVRNDGPLHRLRHIGGTGHLGRQQEGEGQGGQKQQFPHDHFAGAGAGSSTWNGTTTGGRQVLSLQAMYSTSPRTMAPAPRTRTCWRKATCPAWWRTCTPKLGSYSSTGAGSRSG